ncbi:MAG: 50S ribosomal protein L18 [Euryarchaeota archaeon]|nr:50S ribosomal protein L18 [Euryarchaeota archaeon]
MATDPRHRVPFRRRREGKTDYRARLRLVRSGKPRLVVRRSLRHTVVQLVGYEEAGDRVLASSTTAQLGGLGWKAPTGNTPAAYLAGLLAGRNASRANITEAVLDIGLIRPSRGSKVFAALKGVIDAGVQVPHSDGVLPSEERVRGGHLNKPEVARQFEEVRRRILSG